jgi:DNA-binding transcriptional ArsR family regulator
MPRDEEQNANTEVIDELDRAIHSPARLKILAFLSIVEGADFTFLLNQTGLTRGNLSSHLRVLEEAGYIDVKKEFVERVPRTLVRLNAEGKKAIQSYRDTMQEVLDGLLGK